jgi:hypothetical protein
LSNDSLSCGSLGALDLPASRAPEEQILAHWEAEVRKVRAAGQLERPLLLDHVPEFIAEGTTFTVRWPRQGS